jgi:hypothetical protein
LYKLLEAEGTEHHTFGSAKKSLMMGDAFCVSFHSSQDMFT